MKTNKGLVALLVSSCILLGAILLYGNRERFRIVRSADDVVWKQILKDEPMVQRQYLTYKIPMLTEEKPIPVKNLDPAKTSTHVIQVPLLTQRDANFKTGCELVSAAMLLQYYGIQIRPEEFYQTYMQKGNVWFQNGVMYGDDPDKVFVGNPTELSGYGCYAGAIVEAMNQVLQGERYSVNVTGSDLEELVERYVAKGNPIIIWATMNMTEGNAGKSWIITGEDGNTREFQWVSGEHCLVLVGEDDQYYYFNDPSRTQVVVGYEKEIVKERYNRMGKQSVIISR